MMKKAMLILLSVVCAAALVGCGGNTVAEVKIDRGTSSIYSEADMDAAIELIKEAFSTWGAWDKCELHSISYAGDDTCSEANIAWMNELEKANDAEQIFTQCIMFESSFHSPKRDSGTWNADQEYTGWQWWLARTDGGPWKIMTFGY